VRATLAAWRKKTWDVQWFFQGFYGKKHINNDGKHGKTIYKPI
jgi:hypothetical protein